MSEISTFISSVDLKVSELIQHAEILKHQLNYQQSLNKDLLLRVEEKDKQMKAQEEQISKLQTAQVIVNDTESAQNARSKINELVREIDKCIALLNK